MNLHAHLSVHLSLDDRKMIAVALKKYIEGLHPLLYQLDARNEKQASDLLARLQPRVRIIVEGRWKDTIGILEDPIPETEWWNVLIPDLNIRLCLVPDEEFTLLP